MVRHSPGSMTGAPAKPPVAPIVASIPVELALNRLESSEVSPSSAINSKPGKADADRPSRPISNPPSCNATQNGVSDTPPNGERFSMDTCQPIPTSTDNSPSFAYRFELLTKSRRVLFTSSMEYRELSSKSKEPLRAAIV